MGNHTVNEKENKKKSVAAGLNDKTFIVGMQIKQKVDEKEIYEENEKKTVNVFELEAKGKLQREVVPQEYIKIKAYHNEKLKDSKSVEKKSDKEKDEEKD